MRRFFALCLFTICILNTALADHYTIDKRRYVSDDEWATEPYKFVVELTDNGGNMCSGNLVGTGLIATAAHCQKMDNWNGYGNKKGVLFSTTDWPFANGSKYNETKSVSDDFMLYDIHSDTIGNNNVLGNPRVGHPLISGGVVKVLGFGTLKIMSDEEIEQFRNDYINFLRNTMHVHGNRTLLEQLANSNSDYYDPLMKTFINDLRTHPEKYRSDINMFHDYKLKETECFVSATDTNSNIITLQNCQLWGGNSGGGVYINTKFVPRTLDNEYLNYLKKELSEWEEVEKGWQNVIPQINTWDEQKLKEYDLESKHEAIREVNYRLVKVHSMIQAIKQEIQSVLNNDHNSDWMLLGVESSGYHALNSDDFAKINFVASLKRIGIWGGVPYINEERDKYSGYINFIYNKLSEDEVPKKGHPAYFYKKYNEEKHFWK